MIKRLVKQYLEQKIKEKRGSRPVVIGYNIFMSNQIKGYE
jgi:hypothetical protein